MDQETEDKLRKLIAKGLDDEALEAKRRKEWGEKKDKFSEFFAQLARTLIKPHFQQAAHLLLEQNFPTGIYEAELKLSLQVARRGQGLDVVGRKEFPGVSLNIWGNFHESGFIVIDTGGLTGAKNLEKKLEPDQLSSDKIVAALEQFIPLALLQLWER